MGRKSRSTKPKLLERRRPEGPEQTTAMVNVASGETPASSSIKEWLFAAALIAAVFLTYQPAWRGAFIWDDDLHLIDNPVLKAGGLARAWTPGSYISYWPLTFTVYRFEFDMWGLDTLGFHLVNIGLHAVSALLVWRVLVELNAPGAMLAAALFALHPVNVESVAWISQLKGVLSLLFALFSTLFYLKYDRQANFAGGGRGMAAQIIVNHHTTRPAAQTASRAGQRGLYAAAIAAFLLSTLAKGMAITLPIVLLACAWWRRGSIRRRDLVCMVPFVLIGALMAGIEIATQHAGDNVRSDSLPSRAAVAGCAVWFYLGKALWPVNLCFVYPRWKINDGDALRCLPGLLLAILFMLAWRRRGAWGRPVVMLVVCYVGLLLPVLGFVNIGYMRYSLVADHWQYAAMIVPCSALAAAAASATARMTERQGPKGHLLRSAVAWSVALSLLAVLAGLTARQSRLYAERETLWNDTLAKDPNCWLAHDGLGATLFGRGNYDDAISHYQKALDLQPDFASAHRNLGVALAGRGQVDAAIYHYRRALKSQPNDALAHFNLGLALAGLGHVDEAIGHYQEALKSRPDDIEAHISLGESLARRGQVDEAIEHYKKALEIQPNSAGAHSNLGIALADRGRVGDAIAHYRKALEIEPELALAHNNLANALARLGQFDEAIVHFQKALQIQPDLLEAHFNIGLALDSRGQHDEALKHYQKALDLATARNDNPLTDDIRAKIKVASKGE